MKEQEKQSKEISRVFNISRALAIVSVITAHTPFDIENPVICNFIERFSSIGVIVFIIISGYYFNPTKYSTLKRFFKSKVQTIILPWIIMGSLIFIESRIVMGQAIDFVGWLSFLVGYNSFLYYLTVLMICYLIYFYFVKSNCMTTVCTVSFLITIVSQQLTAWGIVDVSKVNLTNYLNIFNWVGYFCLGVLLKKVDVYSVINWLKKHILFLILSWFALFVMAYFLDSNAGYFSIFAIPLQIIGAIIVFALCAFEIFDCGLTRFFSRISFCVYLIHTFFVAVVDKYIGDIAVIELFMPIVTLFVIAVILYIFEMITCKNRVSIVLFSLMGVRIELEKVKKEGL